MKRLIFLASLILAFPDQVWSTTFGEVLVTNVAPVGTHGFFTDIIPGSETVGRWYQPAINFSQIGGQSGPVNAPILSGQLNYQATYMGDGTTINPLFRGFNMTDNLWVSGNITASGYVIGATNILWVTNNIYVTNAQYSAMATNASDGYKIASTNYVGTNLTANLAQLLANTNTWTGTNTFTNTVNLNGPIKVLGTSGGTTNVPVGGMTLHFVNGFYIGYSVP